MASHGHQEHHHKEHEEHRRHKDHKEQEADREHQKDKEHQEHERHRKHEDDKEEEPLEKKQTGRKEMELMEEKGESVKIEGIHLKKRDLWLVAGGALGAIAALGLSKMTGKVRPAAVGAVREGYAFKEWLAAKAEKVKEDVEDVVAEGVHQYHSGLAATADTVKREKDILEKIEKMVEEKLAKMKPGQGEGE